MKKLFVCYTKFAYDNVQTWHDTVLEVDQICDADGNQKVSDAVAIEFIKRDIKKYSNAKIVIINFRRME